MCKKHKALNSCSIQTHTCPGGSPPFFRHANNCRCSCSVMIINSFSGDSSPQAPICSAKLGCRKHDDISPSISRADSRVSSGPTLTYSARNVAFVPRQCPVQMVPYSSCRNLASSLISCAETCPWAQSQKVKR